MSSGARWGASFEGAPLSAMEVYDEVFVPRVFEPWANLLADQLQVARDEQALDVACGPGSVARVLSERVGVGGRVTACDLSPAMLELANAKLRVFGGAEITYLEAPADDLPVEDATFDVVTCQQGLQFFPDRPTAIAEMHRALRPGGRVGVAVWTEIERSPTMAALADAVEQVAGAELAARYRLGPWGFPDPEQLGELLRQAGFQDVEVTKHVLPVRYELGAPQVASTLPASGIAEYIEKLQDEQKRQLVDSVTEITGSGPIDSAMESNVAIATR
ncbi:MAG TPA: class I SAM-dependent methyltransferase [Solirubrobacteraceae bacterium]